MTKFTVKEQKELFEKNCKTIELSTEYSSYTGFEKWAIVTDLSEEELESTYPDILSQYVPFLILSFEQNEAINEFNRNNDKHEKEQKELMMFMVMRMTYQSSFIAKSLLRLLILSRRKNGVESKGTRNSSIYWKTKKQGKLL